MERTVKSYTLLKPLAEAPIHVHRRLGFKVETLTRFSG
jgi:hypothetical protein